MIEGEKLERQRERLAEVSAQEWEVALDELTSVLLDLLGGFIVGGEHNEKLIKGGKTAYGAHSEAVLGENALYFYQSEFVLKLYDGAWEWPEERSLSDQLAEMARSVTRHASDKYSRRKATECNNTKKTNTDNVITMTSEYGCHIIEFTKPVDVPIVMDVERLYKESETADDCLNDDEEDNDVEIAMFYNEDSGTKHVLWELLCDAAEGNRILEEYVQVVGESGTLKEVRTRLGLKPGDTEDLKRELKKRVNKNR